MRALIILSILLWTSGLNAQLFFNELASMPEAVTNNAVTQGSVNGEMYVYSFSGLDSTKLYSGIHKKAWRYSVTNDDWEAIDPLPSGNGRIAAGASTVKNKIYIIGGYEVFSNGNESSFEEVHVYDPETNTYLPNGAPCLLPIDDHVQAVWKDSLIFVVTGWSNTGNVAVVQIYNPAEDSWEFGTSVPSSNDYRVFGATGTIIGDTLYYTGGASDACCNPAFPPISFFRKGYINPDDPTDITWTGFDSEEARIYRGLILSDEDDCPVLVFGSDVTYNYDGIDYNGSGGVEPSEDLVIYNTCLGSYELLGNQFTNPLLLMDLRGFGSVGDPVFGSSEYIVAGGMLPGQTVSNKTYSVSIGVLYSAEEKLPLDVSCFPNPNSGTVFFAPSGEYDVQLSTLDGRLISKGKVFSGDSFMMPELSGGTYLLRIIDPDGKSKLEKIVIQ